MTDLRTLGRAMREAQRAFENGWAEFRHDRMEQMRAAEAAFDKALEAAEARNCTCHPDDNPPRPCPGKYALSHCLADALEAAERQLAAAREALESIAANTCCDTCQEAALVARAVLANLAAPAPKEG